MQVTAVTCTFSPGNGIHGHSPILLCNVRARISSFRIRSTPNLRDIHESPKSTPVDRALPPIQVSKRVVLVRHGQSTWNEEGRIQGSSDFSVLTKKGEAQAYTSRFMLLDDSFHVCFTSPLMRSKRTAEIIWGTREDEMITDHDLREVDLYSFQGLLKREGNDKFGAAFRQWQLDPANFTIDGHYPVRELWGRARSCWNKILAHESRSVLVVAHNAVNQALVATAMGLTPEYFRILLQSNCGVSVLDFTPRAEGQSPDICLNRLNQTPSSPIAPGTSAGRNTSSRIILVCHGSIQGETKDRSPLNMLGVIQSQKTAELLLDTKVNSIVSSSDNACVETALAISRVQEAADCLGADHIPRYVEIKQMDALDVSYISQEINKDNDESSSIWNRSEKAWRCVLNEVSHESETEKVVVVVGHPAIQMALIVHCLNLTKEWMRSFHLDAGSLSVVDFPDGKMGRGVVRCINYTSHLGRWSIPITKKPTEL